MEDDWRQGLWFDGRWHMLSSRPSAVTGLVATTAVAAVTAAHGMQRRRMRKLQCMIECSTDHAVPCSDP